MNTLPPPKHTHKNKYKSSKDFGWWQGSTSHSRWLFPSACSGHHVTRFIPPNLSSTHEALSLSQLQVRKQRHRDVWPTATTHRHQARGQVFHSATKRSRPRKPVSSSVMEIKPATVWHVGPLGGGGKRIKSSRSSLAT